MGNHKRAAATVTPEESVRTYANKSTRTVPIVCIGMSAGGLEVLKTIMENLGSNTGLAFVVITHLSSGYRTHLPGLLSQWCKMPVKLVERGMVIHPNHVYIIPPGQEIIVRDAHFSSVPRSKTHGYPNVITLFLESLTLHRKPPGIAVILSGVDSDGISAIEGFARAQGVVIAQSPASAEFQDMPREAIKTGFVDYVLEPEQIPARIEILAKDLNSDQAENAVA